MAGLFLLLVLGGWRRSLICCLHLRIHLDDFLEKKDVFKRSLYFLHPLELHQLKMLHSEWSPQKVNFLAQQVFVHLDLEQNCTDIPNSCVYWSFIQYQHSQSVVLSKHSCLIYLMVLSYNQFCQIPLALVKSFLRDTQIDS